MNKLKETVRRNGFVYLLVHRTPQVAIYVQYRNGQKAGFEVFEVVQCKETRFKQVVIPAREKFPSNTDFGKRAYTAHSLADALRRAFQLQKRILKRLGSNAPNAFAELLPVCVRK